MGTSDVYEGWKTSTNIVDEAQDLMFDSVWESLSKSLRNGLEKGKGVLYLDPNQNMFNTPEEYASAMEYLTDVYAPTIIPLTLNCRNTEQIGSWLCKIQADAYR